MTSAMTLPLRFQVGARTMFAVRRRLVRIGLSLDEAMADRPIELPPLESADHGYLVTSLPETRLSGVVDLHADMLGFVRQRYARRYADLSCSFDDYMATFSGKSRSTLRRKVRKFAKLTGGTLDLRAYRTADEIAEFQGLARRVSAKTYQEKLLDAGLPDDPGFEARMMRAAARDAARGWLLFADNEPVSYLYAPADGDTLIYAYLGYDPDWARHSPGTVLQVEAMRQIIEEGRFRRFDFTEGDGQHKRQFATGSVDCVDLLLLRRTLGNRVLVAALKTFDAGIAFAKRLGLGGLARRLTR
ncbi:GNAT family N-acetyltransferase [Parasphingopyxis algicola]|uniref:GNAT family N-acetyltransferase n=1 Tax=Parasphingopyxis algicola TaxID=2026624 RepID=UPI0015A117C0|nr:GNAT family N-acetyltransferase [Parasphingopyxis algicola]QLC23764.1 GNAT family N-acetyltransferase [Parasphingopyxis algicola]